VHLQLEKVVEVVVQRELEEMPGNFEPRFECYFLLEEVEVEMEMPVEPEAALRALHSKSQRHFPPLCQCDRMIDGALRSLLAGRGC
jgi:hypothetical protein